MMSQLHCKIFLYFFMCMEKKCNSVQKLHKKITFYCNSIRSLYVLFTFQSLYIYIFFKFDMCDCKTNLALLVKDRRNFFVHENLCMSEKICFPWAHLQYPGKRSQRCIFGDIIKGNLYNFTPLLSTIYQLYPLQNPE